MSSQTPNDHAMAFIMRPPRQDREYQRGYHTAADGTHGMAELGSVPAKASPITKPATSSSWRTRSSDPSTAGTPPTSRTSSPTTRNASGSSPHIATVTGGSPVARDPVH